METLREVEIKLKQTCCPLCFHSSLGVTLQCTALDRNCLFIADCRNCGNRFQMSKNSKTISDIHFQIEIEVSELKCPHCSLSGGRLHFQCLRVSKECFFFL